MRGDRYDKAFELAKKAQLAAKPNTDYLLSNAGVLVGNAETRLQYHPYQKSEFVNNTSLQHPQHGFKLADYGIC